MSAVPFAVRGGTIRFHPGPDCCCAQPLTTSKTAAAARIPIFPTGVPLKVHPLNARGAPILAKVIDRRIALWKPDGSGPNARSISTDP